MCHNLAHKTCGLVTISRILHGNRYFCCLLDKTYSNLENFGSYFIINGIGIRLFLSGNGPVLVQEFGRTSSYI